MFPKLSDNDFYTYKYLIRKLQQQHTCVDVLNYADEQIALHDLQNPKKIILKRAFIISCREYLSYIRFSDSLINDLFKTCHNDLTQTLPYEIRLYILEQYLHNWNPNWKQVDLKHFETTQERRHRQIRKKLIQQAIEKRPRATRN